MPVEEDKEEIPASSAAFQDLMSATKKLSQILGIKPKQFEDKSSTNVEDEK